MQLLVPKIKKPTTLQLVVPKGNQRAKRDKVEGAQRNRVKLWFGVTVD
jgi:hypothetical protein